MADTTVVPLKKDRSPNFPFIPLSKAVDRARELFAKAKRHEVRLLDAANAWNLGAKSSTTLQTVGALSAFGLLDDSGSGENKKFKVSDLGWKILEDARPGAKESGLREAALKPKWLAEYAEKWKDGRPDDSVCISELKFDHGFTDDAAAKFLKVFDDTIQFAKVREGDKIADKPAGGGTSAGPIVTPPAVTKAKIGDYVQWTSGEQQQFQSPRQVVWVSEDQSHLRVHGSMTGIPMSEVTIADPPTVAPIREGHGGTRAASAWLQGENTLNVLLKGTRLEIVANVDLEGLERLKEVLGKYEEILQLLQPQAPANDLTTNKPTGPEPVRG